MEPTSAEDEQARTKDELGGALVRTLKQLRRVTGKEGRTPFYREIAILSVDLRPHFLVEETGQPDWAGRTWAYREFIRSKYSDAGYSKDEARPIQTAVRYHTATAIRDRISAEQVEDAGLQSDDILKRERDRRNVRSAILATVAAPADDLNADPGRSMAAALLILQRLDLAQVAALNGSAKTQARAVLARLAAVGDALSAALEAPDDETA